MSVDKSKDWLISASTENSWNINSACVCDEKYFVNEGMFQENLIVSKNVFKMFLASTVFARNTKELQKTLSQRYKIEL